MLAGLGVVDGRQGRYERAAENYRQASGWRTRSATGPVRSRPNGAGAILLAAGKPGQARAQHSAALALASRIGDKYEQARAHTASPYLSRHRSPRPGPAPLEQPWTCSPTSALAESMTSGTS